jgi:glycosyltransferase involved in cell wall biosynthesis
MNLNVLRRHNSIPNAKKVLFVPINTLMVDYYDAFMDNGFELYSINFEGNWDHKKYLSAQPKMEQIFLKACENIKPDWVFMILDRPLLSAAIIKGARKILPNAIFTNWTGDVRDEPKPGVVEVGKAVDITLIVSTGQIELYKQHGLDRVEFLQTGVNVQKFFRMAEGKREKLRKELKHDVVFCANNSKSYPGAALRKEVAVRLQKLLGARFAVYGRSWSFLKTSAHKPIPYNDQNRVYNGSKIVISINNYNDVPMYFSARQLNAMAAGTLAISCYIPGLEKYFDNGEDLVWFKSSDECVELVKYYLKNEDEAKRIGINGSKKVLEHHIKKARIKEMSSRLGFSKIVHGDVQQ